MDHEALVQLAEAVEQMKELVNVIVQGFVAEGFTDREARMLTVRLMCNTYPDEEEVED